MNYRHLFKTIGFVTLSWSILVVEDVYAEVLPSTTTTDSTNLNTSPSTSEVINETIDIGTVTNVTPQPLLPVTDETSDTTPTVTAVEVSGEADLNKTGVDAFKAIDIKVTGENMTEDHLLTEAGLRWSDQSELKIEIGEVPGNMGNHPSLSTSQPVPIASLEVGNRGRVTLVGETKSGIKLDLLWQILGTDQVEWESHSGYQGDGLVRGVTFTGEQNLGNGQGDSIVVFYHGANILDMAYRLVKHDTTEEVPVILSFITTDIDAGQGVETDLDNLARVIPNGNNLAELNGIVYDAANNSEGKNTQYNGTESLPNGGYVGAGFISHFNYKFYSPVPHRKGENYNYAFGVRYDLFGSALQADIHTQLKQKVTIEYLDQDKQVIRQKEYYQGYLGNRYQLTIPNFDYYHFKEKIVKQDDKGNLLVQLLYQAQGKVLLQFLNQDKQVLAEEESYEVPIGQVFHYQPMAIEGYETPSIFNQIIKGKTTYQFIYKKLHDVTLDLIDETTKKKLKSETISVVNDEPYIYVPPTIEGYAPVGKIKITTNQPKTETISYKKLHQVKLKFHNLQGQELSPEESYTVKAGDHFQYDAPRKEGYQVETHYQVTIDGDKAYTFIYKRIYQVQIQYQDETGKTLLPPKYYPIIEGETFNSIAPLKTGYLTPQGFNRLITSDYTHIFLYRKPVVYQPTIPALNHVISPKSTTQPNIPAETTQQKPNAIKRTTKVKANAVQIPKLKVIVPTTLTPYYVRAFETVNKWVTDELKKLNYFSLNTGLNLSESTELLTYMNVNANHSEKLGRNATHDVANALGYSIYGTDKLQKLFNEFGDKPLRYTKEIIRILEASHKHKRIDLPHLAMPIATIQKSGPLHEYIKFEVTKREMREGYPYYEYSYVNPEHVLFHINGYVGDMISEGRNLRQINPIDFRTDLHAYIIAYHPKYKGMPLNKALYLHFNQKFYSDDETWKMYLDTLQYEYPKQKPKEVDAGLYALGAMTLAGAGLVGLRYKRKVTAIFKKMFKFGEQLDKVRQVTQDIPVEDMSSSQIYKHYLKHQEKKHREKVIKPVVTYTKKTVKKAKQFVVQQRKNKQFVQKIVNKGKAVVKKWFKKK